MCKLPGNTAVENVVVLAQKRTEDLGHSTVRSPIHARHHLTWTWLHFVPFLLPEFQQVTNQWMKRAVREAYLPGRPYSSIPSRRCQGVYNLNNRISHTSTWHEFL